MFAIATPLVPLLLLIACGCVEVFSRGLGDFVAVDCCGLLQDQGKLEPLVAPPSIQCNWQSLSANHFLLTL